MSIVQSAKPRFSFFPRQILFHIVFVSTNALTLMYYLSQLALNNPPDTMVSSFATSWTGFYRSAFDHQWEAYRSNLLTMVLAALAWKIVMHTLSMPVTKHIWIFGLALLTYTFRVDIMLYGSILLLWYLFTAQLYHHKYFVPMCWIIMLLTLYTNEQMNHFRVVSSWMDQYAPVWFLSQHRAFHCSQMLNMTFLKLLSYSIDRHRGDQSKQLQKHLQNCKQCTEKQYCLKGRNYYPTQDYSFLSYLNYVLLPPTLLTGPPSTFKNYSSFSTMPMRRVQPQYLRWLVVLVSFEMFQHLLPVLKIHPEQSLLIMVGISLFHLVFIWYKFLTIWKTGRLWAHLYGFDVVDNMSRCICNNYGFEGFWRMWHRGFNQWLVRYLYIPLGGNRTVRTTILSTVSVIAFVAFWHDHTFNILLWAFLLVLCFVPQLVVKWYFRKYMGHLYQRQWFKYTCAVLAGGYIYLLVISNLIGFGYGIDNAHILLQKLSTDWLQLLWSMAIISSASIIMFYLRNKDDDKNY